MKYAVSVLLLFTLSSAASANELWDKVKKGAAEVTEKSSEVIADASKKVQAKLKEDEDRKARAASSFAVNATLSPVNVPFPMAKGINAYYIINEDWMIGLDYLNSGKAIKFFSFEIGEIKERSFTLQAKRFVGNSFNFTMGLGKRTTDIRLAKNLFDLATHNYSETVSEFEAKYVRLGLGNQWQFKKKYTLAVDWISLDIPFSGEVNTSASRFADSAEDKQDIEDAEGILKYYPGGAVVKLNVGLIF